MNNVTKLVTVFCGVALAVIAIPAAEAHASCSTTASSFYQSAGKSETFGNSTAKSYYNGRATLSGQNLSSGDTLNGSAHLYVNVTAFGVTRQVAKVQAVAYSKFGGSAYADLDIYALGVNIYHRDVSYELSDTRTYWRTFFTATQWFTVGPIPLKVKEVVKGSLGYSWAGGPTTNGIRLDIEPKIRAYGSVTVSATIIVASMGVTGTIDFINAGVPITSSVSLSNSCVSYNLNIDAWLDTLDANLVAWVKYWTCSWSGCRKKTATKTIYTYNGIHKNWSIYHGSGSYGF